METQNRLIPHPCEVDKNLGGTSQEWGIPGHPAGGSSARKINPHNFCLQKNSRDWVSGRNFSRPKQFLFKNPHMDLLSLTPSELQHWGSCLKGTSSIRGGTEVSGIKARARGKISPRQKDGQRPWFLFWTVPQQSHRASRQVLYLRLHQPG